MHPYVCCNVIYNSLFILFMGFIGRTDAEAETPILWPPDAKSWLIWKDPDAGKDLKAGGEGYDRGWDGWMSSPTQWTWIWVNSGSGWWIGKPSMLQSTGSQRVGHNWATELNWYQTFTHHDCHGPFYQQHKGALLWHVSPQSPFSNYL